MIKAWQVARALRSVRPLMPPARILGQYREGSEPCVLLEPVTEFSLSCGVDSEGGITGAHGHGAAHRAQVGVLNGLGHGPACTVAQALGQILQVWEPAGGPLCVACGLCARGGFGGGNHGSKSIQSTRSEHL